MTWLVFPVEDIPKAWTPTGPASAACLSRVRRRVVRSWFRVSSCSRATASRSASRVDRWTPDPLSGMTLDDVADSSDDTVMPGPCRGTARDDVPLRAMLMSLEALK